MSTECVLCDWEFRWDADPYAAYLPDSRWPLRWDGTRVRTVDLTESPAQTMHLVALAAHWGQDHPEQLRLLLGSEFVMDWVPRALPLPSERGGPP